MEPEPQHDPSRSSRRASDGDRDASASRLRSTEPSEAPLGKQSEPLLELLAPSLSSMELSTRRRVGEQLRARLRARSKERPEARGSDDVEPGGT